MPLHAYGLLIGKITGFREPHGRRPHWLLMVQPSDSHHPPYRVAVNVPATQPEYHSEIEYHIAALKGDHPTVRALRQLNRRHGGAGTPNFLLAEDEHDPPLPRLDYAGGHIIDPKAFPAEKKNQAKVGRHGAAQSLGELRTVLRQAAKSNALVAVFGTGSPMDHETGTTLATGFTGIDNIHMNQGSFNRTNGTLHYRENARSQDGGLIVLSEPAQGIFIKFRAQTVHTDERGHPAITGIPELDGVSQAVRRAIMPRRPRAAVPALPRSVGAAALTPRAAGAPSQPNGQGYIFADFDPDDASGKFIPDNDSGTYKTPFVQKQSLGHTRGPVPTPREYPVMDLSTVVGDTPPGHVSDSNGESVAFDIIGDSGAPTAQKLAGYETKVADLLASDAAASPPAFMFHVGDVVYYYGERAYYYSQFYDPFRAYPAPIFAIPGNHDGVTYQPGQVSLADFQSAFCTPEPSRWPGAGGILRSTMTQPGVFFTLDAPLVSIIGLYSNCGESLGWLDEQQFTFLYQELTRLRAKRQNGLPAVILAIHHFPRWFPGQKDPNSPALDATFAKAGFWPDAVICGHAHLYQRVVRQNVGTNKRQDLPYIMSGAGGYGITPAEEVAKAYMQKIGAQAKGNKLGCVIDESGYVRATVTRSRSGNPTLKFEYRSVKPKSSEPDDSCVVDLSARKVV